MEDRDKAIIRYLTSPQGTITVSLVLTACGILYILATGRWELSFFVIAALLPWVEYWFKRKKK
ncbi:MAG TPA: hypothetical protein VFG05_05125 [Methylocella sp.]|nr:hypothetical protein [Methylocella sp.]